LQLHLKVGKYTLTTLPKTMCHTSLVNGMSLQTQNQVKAKHCSPLSVFKTIVVAMENAVMEPLGLLEFYNLFYNLEFLHMEEEHIGVIFQHIPVISEQPLHPSTR